MSMAITVGQLPDQIGSDEARAFLYCPACGAEYSANRGDYFMASDAMVMRCANGHPRTNLRLVRRESKLIEVQP